ncbi:probable aggregation factor core protein MAFp3, isoform C, putative [Microscilla marina ATCC 23134]|uniref:Probable aggregation factor core protein MAFp3, isoform C, putative n=2 Tax=Microscilla marina TaxID=1027 RepID=A1ZX73_MICM2|nr:probable aggregation factor core protein MAFp3, isoform C, putative [Microscilla marina ATCC 23134]
MLHKIYRMKKLIISCLLLFIGHLLVAQTAPPGNLSGNSLRSWYKANWYDSKHSSLGYDGARIKMYGTIDNINGKVTCVYTGYQQNGANVTFLDPINAEHTIPQSFFSRSSVPRADIHHLFPTHKDANSARGSLQFAELSVAQTNTWYYSNGTNYNDANSAPANVDASSKRKTGSSFEPREDHKGNVARAAFYFYTMYPTIAGNIGKLGDIHTLYQWHLDDPVDDAERKRNQDIETAQGNRNPYVDYPNTVAIAWGLAAPTPSVQFKATSGTQAEGASGEVTYTTQVEISPTPTGTVTIEVQLDPTGTTAQTADYGFTPQTLAFNASTTTQTVSVIVKNDGEVENEETVQLKLTNISTGDIGTNKTHTLTIQDTPPAVPTIQFAQLTGSKQEGNGVAVTYTTQVSINPAPTGTVTVDLQLDATGTTAQASDYSFSNATLSFSPTTTSQNVSVTIQHDTDAEADETVKLKLLNNASGTALGTQATHTLTIKDNPPANTPIITFDNTTGSQQENPDTDVIYTTQLSISPAPTGTVTLQVAIDSKATTATANDYELSTTTLTFSPSQTTQSLEVKVKADGAANENDEEVKFILTNLKGTASVGANGTHTLTIKDAQNVNQPLVFFTQAEGTISEDRTADLVYNTVVKVSPTPTKTYLVELNIDAGQTTATLGEDYAFTPVVLSFSPTKTTHNISVVIKADAPVEPNEMLTLKLLKPSTGLKIGTTPTHTLTIKDANPTGLQNVQIAGMKLYPNITSQYINIANARGFEYQLKVYDMQGKFYTQKTVNTSQYQINVNKLPVGWYLMQINNGKQVMVRRFAVVR